MKELERSSTLQLPSIRFQDHQTRTSRFQLRVVGGSRILPELNLTAGGALVVRTRGPVALEHEDAIDAQAQGKLRQVDGVEAIICLNVAVSVQAQVLLLGVLRVRTLLSGVYIRASYFWRLHVESLFLHLPWT